MLIMFLSSNNFLMYVIGFTVLAYYNSLHDLYGSKDLTNNRFLTG
jgi:hypothetical protein